jgi:hypothetical protein
MVPEVIDPNQITIDPGSGCDERCQLHSGIVDR